MSVITSEQVVNEVRTIAVEQPGHVYRVAPTRDGSAGMCRYVDRDENGVRKAGCIVGQALLRLGLSMDEVQEYEGYPASQVVGAICDSTDEELTWLDKVQDQQDGGYRWDDAVEWADGNTY